MLTQPAILNNDHPCGGDFMGGSIYFDKHARRWVVSIYWEGKRYRIFRNPTTREPFYAKQSAEKQLGRIRTEVDEGYFNPKAWFPDNPLSVKEYAKEWLKCIEVSPNTLKDYTGSVNNHIVPFFGDKDIRRIRYSDLVKFNKWIPREKKGKYNVMSCLRTMLRYAWRSEDIRKVPPFPKLSFDLPEIEYLTMDQQQEVLSHILPRDRPIFEFMMEYGVRPGEARAIQRDAIKGGLIVIKRSFSANKLRETTKTGRVRMFELTGYIKTVIDGMQSTVSPFIFTRAKDGKPYTGKNLNAIWQAACNEVGIKIKLYNACRHSLGCQLLDQGEDMDTVRDILGHTRMEMTRRYAKRSLSTKTKALERRRGRVIDISEKLASK